MVKATILIPAFNAEADIVCAVESALSQTEPAIEVLVIDDCSTDSTAERVRAAMLCDQRLRLLRTPHNSGPSAARNLGLKVAKGDWIALLDADDVYHRSRLSTLIGLADAQRADLASDNPQVIYAAPLGWETHRLIPDSRTDEVRSLTLAQFIAGNVTKPGPRVASLGFLKPILRRSFLQRSGVTYDETVRFAEDFAFYVACLRQGGRWVQTSQSLYDYHVREGSLTQRQSAADLDILRTRQRGLFNAPETRADPALRAAVRRHLDLVDRLFLYRRFTDQLKAKAWADASETLLARPRDFALIAREGLTQAPVIAAKAVRGGYRRHD